MTETKTGTVAVDGGKLYYDIAGTGTPVVLAHAGFLDGRMFDAQWDVLRQQYQVIRYDMLGYGLSDAVQTPVCRRKNLQLLLDHLNVTQAHFVGCSMGGTIVLDFALDQPERVLSLTLVNATPSGFEPQGAPPRYMLEMFEALQQGDVDRASDLQIRIWVDGESREPEAMDADLRARALEMNRIPVQNRTPLLDMQPACPLDPPALSRLGEVTCPALVIAGVLDHAEVARAADLLVDGMPKATKHVIADAAHVPSFEQPEAFNKRLLDFLRVAEA